MVPDLRHRPAHPVSPRVYPEIPQQLESRQRGGPGLAWFRWYRLKLSRGKARASCPLAIFALQCQKPGAPALSNYPRAFRFNYFDRRMGEILQHLPADGGIRIKKPIQYNHINCLIQY
jgi:hypothetical protein